MGLGMFLVMVSVAMGPAALAGSGPAADAGGQKAILITGASSGFGRATTEMLASQGYLVYAGARKAEDIAAAAAEKPVVRGQASYRERIALLPGAVFEATLEDVSRAGAKAEVLGTFRKEDPGQVPIRFEIPYDPAKIDERHTYAVRARILKGDTLGFTTDKVYPVLTRGSGNDVELLLVRVPSAGARPSTE